MPNLNGRGPLGDGPMTGRGRGRCRKSQSEQIKKSQDQSISGDISTPNSFKNSDNSEMYSRSERRRFRYRDNS